MISLESAGAFPQDQDMQLLDMGAPCRVCAPRELPELIGAPYCGMAKSAAGQLSELKMKVVLQTSSGDVSGTFQLKTTRTGVTQLYHFQGAVNREGLFVLHAKAEGERIAVISGTAAHHETELIGNFVLKEPGLPLNAGTFSATRS